MKEKPFDPRRLDIAAFTRAAGMLEGQVPQGRLPRLASSLETAPTDDTPEVTWRAQGSLRPVKGGEAEIWLTLHAEARVLLQCQRCLQSLLEPIEVERRFRFVRGEDEAARLDEESDDDVLALPPTLDLIELLEDELLLALPIVPRHAVCPEPLPMSAGEVTDEEADDEPHPFAALAALRGRQPPQ